MARRGRPEIALLDADVAWPIEDGSGGGRKGDGGHILSDGWIARSSSTHSPFIKGNRKRSEASAHPRSGTGKPH